jgi:hypothetical protein
MRVDWATLCRYVEVDDNGSALVVGAGTDIVFVANFPATIDFVLAARLVGQPDEVEHVLAGSVRRPDMTSLASFEEIFRQGVQNAYVPPSWEAGFVRRVAIQFVAEAEGPYDVFVAVDGNSRSVPFVVLLDPGVG